MPSAHANSLAFLSTFVSLAAAAAVGLTDPARLALVFGVPGTALFLVSAPRANHCCVQVHPFWRVCTGSSTCVLPVDQGLH